MTPEWTQRLLAAVREMRAVQRAYFRNRQNDTLAKARILERKVDLLLAEMEQPRLDVGR